MGRHAQIIRLTQICNRLLHCHVPVLLRRAALDVYGENAHEAEASDDYWWDGLGEADQSWTDCVENQCYAEVYLEAEGYEYFIDAFVLVNQHYRVESADDDDLYEVHHLKQWRLKARDKQYRARNNHQPKQILIHLSIIATRHDPWQYVANTEQRSKQNLIQE